MHAQSNPALNEWIRLWERPVPTENIKLVIGEARIATNNPRAVQITNNISRWNIMVQDADAPRMSLCEIQEWLDLPDIQEMRVTLIPGGFVPPAWRHIDWLQQPIWDFPPLTVACIIGPADAYILENRNSFYDFYIVEDVIRYHPFTLRRGENPPGEDESEVSYIRYIASYRVKISVYEWYQRNGHRLTAATVTTCGYFEIQTAIAPPLPEIQFNWGVKIEPDTKARMTVEEILRWVGLPGITDIDDDYDECDCDDECVCNDDDDNHCDECVCDDECICDDNDDNNCDECVCDDECICDDNDDNNCDECVCDDECICDDNDDNHRDECACDDECICDDNDDNNCDEYVCDDDDDCDDGDENNDNDNNNENSYVADSPKKDYETSDENDESEAQPGRTR